MISIGLSIVILIGTLAIYAVVMLLTGYVTFASYVNAVLLNGAWFLVHRFGEWDIWYPQILKSAGWNFVLISLFCVSLVFVISRFPKIRMAYFLSSGVIVNVILAVIIMNLNDDTPSWGYALIVVVATLVSVFIQWATAANKGFDDSGSFISRIFAAILLLPTPFIIALIMFYMLGGQRGLTQRQLLWSAVIAGGVSLLYFLIDWIRDHKKKVEDDRYMANVRESLERRKEISEAIHEDLDAIEAIMKYLSENATFENMQPLKLERTRILYEEARAIKSEYKGTASDGTLMRLREIRSEMESICGSFSPDDKFTVPPIGGYGQKTQKDSENKAASSDASAFFAGCTTEDEIKRRYRDLCKVYHPDSGNGDSDTFVAIKSEYERLMKKYGVES